LLVKSHQDAGLTKSDGIEDVTEVYADSKQQDGQQDNSSPVPGGAPALPVVPRFRADGTAGTSRFG
jgi:hypothetical protein